MSFDAYLKIEGIPGEALDANHKDWIELTDFHYGVVWAVSGTSSSAEDRLSCSVYCEIP